jgi:hypothetical protein
VEILGRGLEELCASANHVLVLVAPFMKEPVLNRLLSQVRTQEVQVLCVTRWLPQEIAAGVSDLEIWKHFRECGHRRLFLRQDLHAKYYRADGRCLVGSANLTASALGYSMVPNLEILVPCLAGGAGLNSFENELFSAAIEVDDEIAEDTRSLVVQLPALIWSIEAEEPAVEELVSKTPEKLQDWTPILRQPEDLYLAYCHDRDSLTSTAEAAAVHDLGVLRIPAGLDEFTFNVAVGHALLRTPQVKKIDEFVEQPRRFGEVREFLSRHRPIDESPDLRWQTLLRWLMYFLPDRYNYSRPSHSEIISRRR